MNVHRNTTIDRRAGHETSSRLPRRLLVTDRGATAVEYALIVALIAAVIAGVVTNVGLDALTNFTRADF